MNLRKSINRSYLTAVFVAGVSLHCGDDTEEVPFIRPVSGVQFGVIRTDFESTTVAVLDEEGAILDPALISSGLTAPGLTAALSGDVVLATATSEDPGILTVIDRLGTDVITRHDLETGTILGQVRVAPGDFSTNPQDMAYIDANQAWVSRFSVNLDEDADVADLANDVIEINPTDFSVTGRRVGLDRFTVQSEVEVEGEDGETEVVEVDVYARPSSLVVVGDTLVVGLSLFSFEFDAAAPGQVALIDTTAELTSTSTAGLTGFPLPETARSCGSVASVPNEANLVMVACSGFSRPFGVDEQVRASSGVYVLRISNGGAELVSAWAPADYEDAPLALNNLTPISSTRFVAVDNGDQEGTPDEAYIVDMETGEATLLFAASSAFAIGRSAYSPESNLILIPDTSANDGVGAINKYLVTEETNWTLEEEVTFDDGRQVPYGVFLVP